MYEDFQPVAQRGALCWESTGVLGASASTGKFMTSSCDTRNVWSLEEEWMQISWRRGCGKKEVEWRRGGKEGQV